MSHAEPADSPAAPKGDTRSFGLLNVAMFQGALSDNIFKFLLTMVVIAEANRIGADEESRLRLAGLYKMVVDLAFVVPYVIAVAVAGWLADRFSKSRVTRWTKVMEVGVMATSVATLAMGNVWGSVFILFLMALQSALFSPSKYGILPELLPANRLGWANGVLQGLTFIAIVMGTVVGPWLYGHFADRLWITGAILLGMAVVGLLPTLGMRELAPADPSAPFAANPVRPVMVYGREIAKDTGLRWGFTGLVVWWMSAAMMLGAATIVATNLLKLGPAQVGIALLPIVIGQGIGCFLAGFISRSRIELGQVPIGAFGMFAAGTLAWWMIPLPAEMKTLAADHKAWLELWLPMAIGMVGFFSGFFIVPLEAYVVHQSDPKIRGGVWATGNVLSAVGMMAGSVFQMALTSFGRQNPGDVFLLGGAMMLVTAWIICVRFPRIPLRFMILTLLRTFYRTRVRGVENVPATGGALLIANHQSFLDGILLASAIDRPIRFIMSKAIYRTWFVYPFARLTQSIPIEQNQSPRELIQALREAADEIRAGGLVCIFPEGQLTRNGVLMPFRRGLERIMKDLDAPIVPIAIDGAWDTAMAKRQGRFRVRPRRTWKRTAISVVVGPPVPSQTHLHHLRQTVVELQADAFALRKEDCPALHRMGIANLRGRALKRDFSDHSAEELLPNFKVLAAMMALGLKLRAEWEQEEFVGILLPPSIGSMALNMAALAGGRVPVNLNYTSSPQIIEETCRVAGIRVIFTSRLFLEKLNLQLPDKFRVVLLEDVRKAITGGDRLKAMLLGMFAPVASIERMLGRTRPAQPDDLATLIFSSGSTGIPKGVMLSHWNIWSNLTGALQVFHVPEGSRLLGILPFFHSFGFTGTLWLPLLKGVGASYYPNPLDAKVIGAIVEKYRVTHLLATPTFLSTYTRRIEPGQFGSLKLVLTGAEKLKDPICDAFRRQFGITPVEGFGCTETSPITSINGQDYREPGIYQAGAKRGTVGHPIPGVVCKIVDLDTGEPAGPNEAGMLLVRGANVMQGYYKDPAKTADAMVDGAWYRTGDIAKIDDDGFLTITDRLARFSKIGGEMVPHVRIEEALMQAAGASEPVFAVCGIADEKKGERLVVLFTCGEEQARAACEAIGGEEFNLPPLWLPKWADFAKVPAIPILGTGKLDLRGVKDMAAAAMAKKPEKAAV